MLSLREIPECFDEKVGKYRRILEKGMGEEGAIPFSLKKGIAPFQPPSKCPS